MMRDVGQRWEATERNGGSVRWQDDGCLMALPSLSRGYANAQLDDYRGTSEPAFRWAVGTRFTARARFSAEADQLVGTAGFGFWNAPFGPGTGSRLRLPRVVWFFYASNASNLPLAPLGEEGNGWFAATIDAQSPRALRWAPLAFPVLLLNQFYALRRVLWPMVRRDLNISFQRVGADMRAWHVYGIDWRAERIVFRLDGQPILIAPRAVSGPLGFVTWMDNQAMVLTPRGKIWWKTEPVAAEQWLEVNDIVLEAFR